MQRTEMTSLDRTMMALSHQEPDRVPLFLLFTFYGAKELGTSIRDYFASPDAVVEGQVRLREKFGHDCYVGPQCTAAEIEAFGGEVIFREDGPPVTGRPFLQERTQIASLEPPRVAESPALQTALQTIRGLKQEAGDEVPIIGAAISPFSLPIMQMGFGAYLHLIYEDPELFERLMETNEEFCVEWANAQLEAGVTAVGYYDPMSSPTILPAIEYVQRGFPVACRTISRISGAVAMHFASGRCLPILKDVARTGVGAIGVSADEDLREMKSAGGKDLALLGNLNGIEMRRWDKETAEQKVKNAIARAGAGGGFVLADNHGEIPYQVPEHVLHAISDAARKRGTYPLDWVGEYGG